MCGASLAARRTVTAVDLDLKALAQFGELDCADGGAARFQPVSVAAGLGPLVVRVRRQPFFQALPSVAGLLQIKADKAVLRRLPAPVRLDVWIAGCACGALADVEHRAPDKSRGFQDHAIAQPFEALARQAQAGAKLRRPTGVRNRGRSTRRPRPSRCPRGGSRFRFPWGSTCRSSPCAADCRRRASSIESAWRALLPNRRGRNPGFFGDLPLFGSQRTRTRSMPRRRKFSNSISAGGLEIRLRSISDAADNIPAWRCSRLRQYIHTRTL